MRGLTQCRSGRRATDEPFVEDSPARYARHRTNHASTSVALGFDELSLTRVEMHLII
jgi:hypothetical protein